MYFDFEYDADAELEELTIKPSSNENPDELHDYSEILKVVNPLLKFYEHSKYGKYEGYDEHEYETMLYSIKEYERLFFKQEVQVNIFKLLADMTEYFFKNFSFENKGMAKDDFELSDPEPLKSPWE